MADASRRGFLAALSGIMAAGAPVAAAAAHSPHDEAQTPDAELLAAGERLRRAVAADKEARAALDEANIRFGAAIGWCPPLLAFYHAAGDDELQCKVAALTSRREVQFDYDTFEEHGPDAVAPRWTGRAVRAVLQHLPDVYGHAGRTPKLIRHYREVLALAEVREAQRDRWRQHYRLVELNAAARTARVQTEAAEAEVDRLPATTLAGIGVKMQHVEAWRTYHRERGHWTMAQPACVESLFAAVLAVTAPVQS